MLASGKGMQRNLINQCLKRSNLPRTIEALLLELLCQECCAQDERCVLLALCLQITGDLQNILTVKSGYLFRHHKLELEKQHLSTKSIKAISESPCKVNKQALCFYLQFSQYCSLLRRGFSCINCVPSLIYPSINLDKRFGHYYEKVVQKPNAGGYQSFNRSIYCTHFFSDALS